MTTIINAVVALLFAAAVGYACHRRAISPPPQPKEPPMPQYPTFHGVHGVQAMQWTGENTGEVADWIGPQKLGYWPFTATGQWAVKHPDTPTPTFLMMTDASFRDFFTPDTEGTPT